jgi:hypothetical protein
MFSTKTRFYGIENFLFGDKPHFGEFCTVQNLKLRYNMGYISPAETYSNPSYSTPPPSTEIQPRIRSLS